MNRSPFRAGSLKNSAHRYRQYAETAELL
ncbi:hypothetical protein PM8797T_31658 [Gimesia maris DSM 8797]|nr:hypothetical protein PM8797T_31658 [Gimesia maris DSM 8797]